MRVSPLTVSYIVRFSSEPARTAHAGEVDDQGELGRAESDRGGGRCVGKMTRGRAGGSASNRPLAKIWRTGGGALGRPEESDAGVHLVHIG